MNIINRLIPLVLLTLVASCGGRGEGGNGELAVIDVPQDRLDSGEKFDSLFTFDEYVVLEATDKSLITSYDKISLHNGEIFIKDAGTRVLRFGRDGKFLNAIDHFGEGPGEYTYMMDFNVKDDSVYILDGLKGTLLSYSLDGEYGSSREVGQGNGFVMLDDGVAMNSCMGWGKKADRKNFSYLYQGENGAKIYGAPFNENLRGRRKVYDVGANYFYDFGDELLTIFQYNDTVYSVDRKTGELSPYLIAKIGERSIPVDADRQTCKTMSESDIPNNIFSLYKWGNHIMFYYDDAAKGQKYPYKSVIADAKSGEIIYCGGFDSDSNKLPVKIFSYDNTDTSGERRMLSVVPAINVTALAERDKNPEEEHPLLHEIASKINEDSNQVLVFYKYNRN